MLLSESRWEAHEELLDSPFFLCLEMAIILEKGIKALELGLLSMASPVGAV